MQQPQQHRLIATGLDARAARAAYGNRASLDLHAGRGSKWVMRVEEESDEEDNSEDDSEEDNEDASEDDSKVVPETHQLGAADVRSTGSLSRSANGKTAKVVGKGRSSCQEGAAGTGVMTQGATAAPTATSSSCGLELKWPRMQGVSERCGQLRGGAGERLAGTSTLLPALPLLAVAAIARLTTRW